MTAVVAGLVALGAAAAAFAAAGAGPADRPAAPAAPAPVESTAPPVQPLTTVTDPHLSEDAQISDEEEAAGGTMHSTEPPM